MSTMDAQARSDSLHRRLLVCNLHDDWSIEVQKMTLAGDRGGLDRTYADRMRTGGVDFTFYTVGGDDIMFTQDLDLLRGTLRALDGALEEIGASRHFALCRTPADIVAAKATGRVGLMLTMEGASPIGEDMAVLRDLYRLGLRSVILTWFKANQVGDGVGERRNGGLSTFGRALIAEMNRLGMLIDITQSAPATVEDVLAETTRPVIASHSNCAGVYPHRRNLADDQLRGLAATGGMIGVTSYPAHVGEGSVDVERFLDHIDYAAALVGIDHVGVGLNIVVHSPAEAQAFYTRSGIEYSDFHLTGLEDVDRMSAVTEGLLRRGYRDEDVAKVLGGNLLRVLQHVMGGNCD